MPNTKKDTLKTLFIFCGLINSSFFLTLLYSILKPKNLYNYRLFAVESNIKYNNLLIYLNSIISKGILYLISL